MLQLTMRAPFLLVVVLLLAKPLVCMGADTTRRVLIPTRTHRRRPVSPPPQSTPGGGQPAPPGGGAATPWRRQAWLEKLKSSMGPKFRPGRLNPDQFRDYYVNEWQSRHLRVTFENGSVVMLPPTTEPQPMFQWLKTLPIYTTTESRITHYYEPYWKDGHWVFHTAVSTLQEYDYNAVSKRATTLHPAGGSWTTHRFCAPVCLTIYMDYGQICAARLVSRLRVWMWNYATFDNMCDLEHANCAYYQTHWVPLHRGPCPPSYLLDSKLGYKVPQDWTPETLIPHYGFAIASHAAYLASMTFRPYRQGVYGLAAGKHYTRYTNDWDRRRRAPPAATAAATPASRTPTTPSSYYTSTREE